jgi:hypothetical protein
VISSRSFHSGTRPPVRSERNAVCVFAVEHLLTLPVIG